MSGRIVREVLDCAPADLTLAEMAVYVVLAEGARDRTRAVCTPATLIAYRARVSDSTCRKALSTLARRGLIHPLLVARQGTTQRYRLAVLEAAHRRFTIRGSVPPEEPLSVPEGEPSPSLRLVDNPDGTKSSVPVEARERSSRGTPLRTTTVTTSWSLETNNVSGATA